jgi:spore coat polysaccharide biosynthesis protein SpsF
MNISIIIEARMGSSRLPGKVMLPVNGKTMLDFMVDRLRIVKNIKNIILATSIKKENDILEKFSKKKKILCFRGSENNLVSRIINAAKKFKVDVIVNLTADCPIIDPEIINECIFIFMNNKKKVDIVSNCYKRSYPDGMDVLVYKLKTLIKSKDFIKSKLDLEHTTISIKNNIKKFKCIHLVAPVNLFYPNLRLTLDYISDYWLLKKVIKYFKKNIFFSCNEVINLLKKKKWAKIN